MRRLLAKVETQEDEKDLIRVRRNREEWAHMRETEGVEPAGFAGSEGKFCRKTSTLLTQAVGGR